MSRIAIIILAALGPYGIAFIALALAGRKRDWPSGFAFRYASNATIDRILGVLFTPAYTIAHLFGIDRLYTPWPSAT